MRCDACPANAIYQIGSRPLCYFCSRQVIFDLVRGGNIRFCHKGKLGGLAVISFRKDPNHAANIRIPDVVHSLRLGGMRGDADQAARASTHQ